MNDSLPSSQRAIDPVALLKPFAVTDEYVKKLGKEEFLYDNLILRHHVVTIIAMSGGGKTTFCFYHVAPELAKKGKKVWYIDADSPASDHRLMKATADKFGFEFLNPDTNQGTSIEGLREKLNEIADSGADLSDWVIFIDTLKKMADLMHKGSVKKFYLLCRKLANRGATVVLLGHANKYRDKSGNLVFEGVGDVRSDSDELIYFEFVSNPNGGIDVTTVVDPDRGAKVRGIFEPLSFHIDRSRQITFYESPIPPVDRSSTATPKATDEEILDAAEKYLRDCGQPIKQVHLIDHLHDLTGASKGRVRKLIVQNSAAKNSTSRERFAYTVGASNAHSYEIPS